ncbi:hypothetical protein D3C77_788110 [compost metagenome]
MTACSGSVRLYCSGYRRSVWQATPCSSTRVKLKLPLRGATIRHFNGEKAWERVPMAA